jgi:hypothetical protein
MMEEARYYAAAIALPATPATPAAARIAVFGGFDGACVSSSVSAFTPQGDAASSGGYGSWQELPPMPEARMAAGCTLFQGRVALVGGAGNKAKILKSADVWDAQLQVWFDASHPLGTPNLKEYEDTYRCMGVCMLVPLLTLSGRLI